jgi:hypothetical protein
MKNKNFVGQGFPFEDLVSAVLQIPKNERSVSVLVNGLRTTVYPDFYWGSKIVEAKTSFGAFKPKQAGALAVHAKELGKELVYLFYKKPTDKELEQMRQVMREAAGDDAPVVVNWIFE